MPFDAPAQHEHAPAAGSIAWMRLAPRSSAALQLLSKYLPAITGVDPAASPEVSHAAHLHHLVALSVGATRDGPAMATRSVRAARLQAIKSDILIGLSDQSLSLATIAARHGITSRTYISCS